jgi:GH15 family glucan-1,4-alpha-glucosidase
MIQLGTRGTAWTPETRLYSEGVVIGHDGAPLIVPPHSTIRRVPGTGYLDVESGALAGAMVATPDQIDESVARLEMTAVPGGNTPYGDMARTAIVDIEVLTLPNGAAVAAGSPYWRYVWPRDAGFMSVAMSQAGRHDDARRMLDYVAAMQEQDGGWHARYLPDGSGDVPDGRGRQLDGIGWTLWAAWVWSRTGGGDPTELIGMIGSATQAALAALDDSTRLPHASEDYWEMDIEEPTLGSAAPLLLGLRCGQDLLGMAGHHGLATRAARASDELDAAIQKWFGSQGFRRRLSGRRGWDASVAFLLPPFAARTEPIEVAWRSAVAATSLANGGVRPGEEWTDLDTAWTPQMSLHALVAASLGDTAMAHRFLSWLDLRRTHLGSLPEKITTKGWPAAVAPLGITAATVLIALGELEGNALPVATHHESHGGSI